MTNREIIVIDSSDEEFEFDWEPDNKDDFAEVYVPDAFASYCFPIHCAIIHNPVICADGHSYKRTYIQRWLSTLSQVQLQA